MSRSLFLSDLHIGSDSFDFRRFDSFAGIVKDHDFEFVYLAGDIIDLRYLRKSRRSHLGHYISLENLFNLVNGRKTAYTWGNHDPEMVSLPIFVLRAFEPFTNFTVQRQVWHDLADGRRMLILHGDEVDARIRTGMSKAFVNRVTRFYYRMMGVDRLLLAARRTLLPNAQPLVPRLKRLLPRWRRYLETYEAAIVRIAREEGADVVMCGHTHTPTLRTIDGILFINVGDWVEHCTAVIEEDCGRLTLVDWRMRPLATG